MHDAALNDARHDGPDERDGEGVVDVELERCRGIVVPMVRQDVEERADQVEILPCDVRDLEDGADALRDELSGCIDAALAVGDEDRDLACAGRLEDPRYLRDSLLEDVRWADVDLSDDDHHGNVERERDTEMLFAHADEPVVRGDHQQAVVRA